MKILALVLISLSAAPAAILPADTSGVTPGPIAVEASAQSLTVRWQDDSHATWSAEFSLDSSKPLITAISAGDRKIMDRAEPIYRCSTGKRRKGWDAFFDFPPSAPEGTRSFLGEFHPTAARARTEGDRVEISFDGMRCGIFAGRLQYTFYPGTRLIRQEAILSTTEPDTAYFYDAGLRMTADADRRAGFNMESHISYFDTSGQFQTITPPYGSEWHPVAVRYRAIAARMGAGSVVAFPPPHQYFFARDYTTNMGYVWHSSWRGHVSLGIRQLPDDNAPYYPWMNAPPGTEQRMAMFLLVDAGEARSALEDVLRYTHRDHYPVLTGYKTFEPHWHLAYTVQAMEKGFDWQPPFKAAMEAIGLNAAMIMEFHGDGHPQDTSPVRLKELNALYKACRAQSDGNFLLIPSEEADVYLGGHWGLVFPKPVYWFMKHPAGEPFVRSDPEYGNVYHVGSAAEMWDVVLRENGYVYQTHPRTKGSTGYPDKIRETDYFRDPRFLGTGWKAMPSDLSSPRLSERGFKILDDMNNWGDHKRAIGEVDVFQVDSTHELYGHMNVNYVRVPELPTFDHYGDLLNAVARGDFFTTTGEILLPESKIQAGAGDAVQVHALVDYTFPLAMAEVVWGDGAETHRKIIPLTSTPQFQKAAFDWNVDAPGWKWARFAVWDVAGNGAFVNPIWREPRRVVAVDGYHNDETKQPLHYRWEGTGMGGFSEFAKLLRDAGADLTTMRHAITPASLQGIDCFILADPDTPEESDHPRYLEAPEIDALTDWVQHGGRLVLLGNDKGNAEFAHFNQLAGRFGVQFVETTYGKARGHSKLTLTGKGPLFDGAPVFYAVDVAPLKITARNAQVLLADGRTPLMALIPFGQGKVFALGDPWIYNEYIGRENNRQIAAKVFRALLQ